MSSEGHVSAPQPHQARLAGADGFWSPTHRLDIVQRLSKPGFLYALAARVRDVIVSFFLLVFFAPLFAILAILIKLDSHGPVFFVQNRGGKGQTPFRCFKFRTMTVMEDGPVIQQAKQNDARVTTIGRFLRRSSLDELPQLLNVLFGSMSLVGPRPHALAHDKQYAASIPGYTLRSAVKPGITGLSQISGLRGECNTIQAMAQRVECDLQYINTRTFFGDLKILLLTPIRLLFCDKAY